MRAAVEKIIKIIRPAIQADEGDIDLIDVDESTGVVTVELHGACVTCPASTQTLKAGIERIMRDSGAGGHRGGGGQRPRHERVVRLSLRPARSSLGLPRR